MARSITRFSKLRIGNRFRAVAFPNEVLIKTRRTKSLELTVNAATLKNPRHPTILVDGDVKVRRVLKQ